MKQPNWIFGLALGALFLRLFQLGEWPFWHDEALTILLTQKPIAELIAITASDVHPPLYFLLLKPFLWGGQSEFGVRLLSALFGTASVLMLYLAGRDLFDPQVGLWGALIMALSPLQVFYAQEARMYTQLLFLTVFSSWCFTRTWRDQQGYWWGLLAIGLLMACYTAYFTFPILGAMGLYVFLVDRRRKAMIYFLGTVALTLLLYLPWLAVFLAQTRAVFETYWMAPPSPLALFTTITAFFVGYTLSPFWIAISLAAVLLIMFVTLNSIRYAAKAGHNLQPLIWLLLWAFVPLLGTLLISWVRPIFQLRTVITAAPPLYLLVAWGMTRAPQMKINRWLFLPAACLMSFSLYNFYFNPAFAKPAWRQAAYFVQARVEPGDIVIHTSPGSFLPFLVYPHTVEHVALLDPLVTQENAPSQHIVRAVSPPPQSLEDIAQSYKRVWMVTGLDQSVEYQVGQKQQFDARFQLLEETELAGVYLFLYSLEK